MRLRTKRPRFDDVLVLSELNRTLQHFQAVYSLNYEFHLLQLDQQFDKLRMKRVSPLNPKARLSKIQIFLTI